MSIEVRGAVEARNNMNRVARELAGDATVNALQTSVLQVMRTSRELVTVDTGRLRNSITGEVEVTRDNVVRGIVGSNLVYAPYVETGTRPHTPPLAALQTWARRHGISPFMVQLSIRRRGTRGQFYLRDSLRRHRAAIQARLGRAVTTTIDRYGGDRR